MGAVSPSRYTVQAGWDHVPHLDAKTRKELYDSTPPHLREARSQGVPSLGSGAIYPIMWQDVTCSPFAIPAHWKRGYGMDVGWKKTSAIWGAQDPADGTLYAYSEYYVGEKVPLIHATAVKARGDWMVGAMDSAAWGRSQRDGEQLMVEYMDCGLKLVNANKAVEAGLYHVWQLLETGRLKFFNTLRNTAAEYRIYRRDEKGDVVKENDHLMDALRYMCMTWLEIARVKPADQSVMPGGPRQNASSVGY